MADKVTSEAPKAEDLKLFGDVFEKHSDKKNLGLEISREW